MRKVKVGDIIRVSKGRKATHVTNIKIENALRYIQIEDLRSDNILQYSLDKNGVFVDASDICIAWDGANAGTVGYGLSGIIGSTIARLRLEDKSIYTPYVGRFLQTKFHILNGKTTGTTIPHVERSRLDNLELSLPSFGEQRRIAAILDKADAIRRKRQEALKLADALVKSRFIEMFGDPVANPKGWEQVALSECLERIDSGNSFTCEQVSRQGNNPAILKLSAVTYGTYNPDENKAMLDFALFDERSEVFPGDLLFSRKNTLKLVGMCAYVYSTPIKLMLPDLIFRLVTREKCNKIFLWRLINHSASRKGIQSLATGSAASMPNISKQRLMQHIIPLPPLSLQNQFAAFVEQADKSKFAMQRQLAEAEASKASLMQQFFS